MPPALAAVTHAALCDPGSKVLPPLRTLRRELGPGTLTAFRSDAQSARALLSAGASGLACKEALDVQVRAFLARSWDSFAAAVSQEPESQESQDLHRAASLLGGLLAAAPEAEAREGFRVVLAEWAAIPTAPSGASRPSRVLSCDELRAMLEDHTVALAFAEELSPQAQRTHGRDVLQLLRLMQAEEVTAQAVAEAVTAVVEALPELLDESLEVFRASVSRLSALDGITEGAWASLADASPPLRLAFLEEVVARGGPAAWEACGIDAVAVVTVLADMEMAAAAKRGRRSAQRSSAGPALEGKALERAGRLLEHLGRVRCDLAGLPSDKAMVLARSFGSCLPTEARHAFAAITREIQRSPSRFDEADILAVARALPGTADGACWAGLAQALLARWSSCEPGQLLHTMAGVPALLSAAPEPLHRALAHACEHDAGSLARLPADHLMYLIDAWAAADAPAPAPLQQLLSCALGARVREIDAHRLVAASAILGEGERDSREAEIMLFWQEWMQGVVESCRVIGWGSCYEALRAVQHWRDVSGAGEEDGVVSTAEMVFQGVVAEQICEVADQAPLELLLELGRSVPHDGAVAARLGPSLTQRVQQCVRGAGADGLSLLAAVAVADGETLVRCTADSRLWSSLAMMISVQLSSPHAIDLFCRCRPSPQLRNAVLELLEGWGALELQMRLA